jgi:hypothetical protein
MSEVQQGVAREMTFGEKAVGLTFNPSGDLQVFECKKEFAVVIDRLNTLRENEKNNSTPNSSEKIRQFSVAITEAQTAQMWAVKAITL